MRVSLIVCTRNRPDVLINNLIINTKELEQQDEIIIIDSSDEYLIEQYKTKIQIPNIFFYHVKPGLPFQRNYGVKQASGDIILFLDDDIKLNRGSVDKLRCFFVENSSVDAITGRLIEKHEPSKLKQLIEKYFSKVFFTSYFGKSGFTKSGMPIIPLSGEPFHKSAFMRGGFSAYRRNVFINHSFDEYFNGYAYLEDTDFSFSIINNTYSVFLPEFSGIHDHLSTLQKDHSNFREQYIVNYFYIFNKYSLGKNSLFLWTTFGILLINLIKSIETLNFSFFWGTIKGITIVVKKM